MTNKIPGIRRARGYHLYDNKGRRYLDLYQNGGLAILGHRPEKLSLSLKSVLAKGLICEYPSVYQKRVYRALRDFFPDYGDFRIYRNRERAFKALSLYFGKEITGAADPVFSDALPMEFCLWRPFLLPEGGYPGVVLPVLPFPGDFGPAVVCFAVAPGSSVPVSDIISPMILSAMITVLSRLKEYSRCFPEEKWRLFDSEFWRRRGPYLVTDMNEEEYSRFFGVFLENGIVLPPDSGSPAVVPGEFTPGEIKFLKKMEH